jgi:hypothetical protein
MDTGLYEQFLHIVNSGDETLAREFLDKNKDKFSEATRIALLEAPLTPGPEISDTLPEPEE